MNAIKDAVSPLDHTLAREKAGSKANGVGVRLAWKCDPDVVRVVSTGSHRGGCPVHARREAAGSDGLAPPVSVGGRTTRVTSEDSRLDVKADFESGIEGVRMRSLNGIGAVRGSCVSQGGHVDGHPLDAREQRAHNIRVPDVENVVAADVKGKTLGPGLDDRFPKLDSGAWEGSVEERDDHYRLRMSG
jgi:hypothetical protein